MKRPPHDDPIAAYQRKSVAARRVGFKKRCACGESRPEALIAGSKPSTCAKCQREKRKRCTSDRHHVAGKSNSRATIRVPVNDHRAILSISQHGWPRQTLANPNGSPLLAAAACIRGFVDTIYYLIEKFLLWIPELLEALDAFLTEELGSKWWVGTPLEKHEPPR